MFTGLVDHCGVIKRIEKLKQCTHFYIQSQFSDLALGESMAMDGICLTVDAIKDDTFRVKLSKETLKTTAAACYQLTQQVNLERAMRLQDRLGGHIVTGHIDTTMRVAAINTHTQGDDTFIEMQFTALDKNAQRYLITKGSVAVNGVSLTINQVQQNEFTVMLIPHTLSRTDLKNLTVGGMVNIEYDYLAKIVAQNVGWDKECVA